jgi:hypothetical protein
VRFSLNLAIAIHGALHCSTVMRVIYVLCVLGVLVPDAAGGRRHHRRHDCPPFTCGHLSDVSFPFRRRGDPPECGVQSYELTCADDKATIQIDKETYSEIRNSSWMYMPVACLSTSRSFVYVFTGQQSAYIQNLEPSCGYLATTPLGGSKLNSTSALQNVSYQDVVKLMMTGFAVRFPFTVSGWNFKECLALSIR